MASSFRLYDYDGDGFITKPEMERYLASVFRVMLTAEPVLRSQVGDADPVMLAKQTTEECFREHDVNVYVSSQ